MMGKCAITAMLAAAMSLANITASFAVPLLTRDEAFEILENSGCKEPRVLFLVNGIGLIGDEAVSADSAALAGVGCDGAGEPSAQYVTFFYDEELEHWLHYELTADRIITWSADGYLPFPLK